MPFSDLVRGASLRGSPAQLGTIPGLRLGRSIGTVWRQARPGAGSTTVVVGRSRGAAEAAARDGLVAGLVASGFIVADVGVIESERFTGVLRQGPSADDPFSRLWPAVGGVFVASTGESLGVMLFDGMHPVVGSRLTELARTADTGIFCIHGGGHIVSIETRTLPMAAAPEARGNEALDDVAA